MLDRSIFACFSVGMYQDDLAKLSRDELIALGLSQTAQIEALTQRIAELEANLKVSQRDAGL